MEAVLPLDQMSMEEKLRALEKIWEALTKDEAQLPVPDRHKKVLDQRQQQIGSGEAKFILLEEFKERVRKQTG
jgi:putative addiction module component (TIGR02574 family)